MTTTTTVPAPSSTASPDTTAPGVVTVSFGSIFGIAAIPDQVSAAGLEVRVRRARLVDFDRRPNVETEINSQLDTFVDSRLATYLPSLDLEGPPAEYSLEFEVLWLEETAWPVLTVLYTETARPADAAEATVRKFVLMFDLPTGIPLTVSDMLTTDGVASLEGMILERLAGTLGERFCCFEPGELVANSGVAEDGLRVYIDLSGPPPQVGSVELGFPWAEVAHLIDMQKRFLAPRAVDAGHCSVQGEEFTLSDQAGLPEAVSSKRRAIFDAAMVCDFDSLGALVPLDEPYSLWGSQSSIGGSAELWRAAEASGYAPLRFLARTLDFSYVPDAYLYGEDNTLEWSGYVWPAAASGEEWGSLSPEARAELADLYDDEEMAAYSEWGWFSGFRVMISDDGTWWYFGFGGD
jgi:hypothetical protein